MKVLIKKKVEENMLQQNSILINKFTYLGFLKEEIFLSCEIDCHLKVK